LGIAAWKLHGFLFLHHKKSRFPNTGLPDSEGKKSETGAWGHASRRNGVS
jgi:hypothetical protein